MRSFSASLISGLNYFCVDSVQKPSTFKPPLQTALPWEVNAWHAPSTKTKPTHCFPWRGEEVSAAPADAEAGWQGDRVTCHSVWPAHAAPGGSSAARNGERLPPGSRCAADIWPSSASCPKWALWGHLHSEGRWLCSPPRAAFTDICTVQVCGLHPQPCQKVWAGDDNAPRHPEVPGEDPCWQESPFLPGSVLAPARQQFANGLHEQQ